MAIRGALSLERSVQGWAHAFAVGIANGDRATKSWSIVPGTHAVQISYDESRRADSEDIIVLRSATSLQTLIFEVQVATLIQGQLGFVILLIWQLSSSRNSKVA